MTNFLQRHAFPLFATALLSLISLSSCSLETKGADLDSSSSPVAVQTMTYSLTTAVPTEAISVPPQSPLPEFILDAIPAPGSELSLHSYQEGWHGATGTWSGEPVNESVCVEFDAGEVLLPGDNWNTADEILERIQFKLNEQVISSPSVVVQLLEEVILLDGEGNEVAWAPRPSLFCWQGDLEVGIQKATFSFRKTSGKLLEYTWSFVLE